MGVLWWLLLVVLGCSAVFHAVRYCRVVRKENAEDHRRAMRELAALSFDPDSMDRKSEVDIWGFHEDG